MRRFEVTLTVQVTLDISERVFKQVLTDEWRAQMYSIHTPEEVAEHLAYNVAANGIRSLGSLDGFANLPDKCMKVADVSWDLDTVSRQAKP